MLRAVFNEDCGALFFSEKEECSVDYQWRRLFINKVNDYVEFNKPLERYILVKIKLKNNEYRLNNDAYMQAQHIRHILSISSSSANLEVESV